MFRLKDLRYFFERRAIKIDKRLRLVISVLILGLLMLFSTFFNFDKAPIFLLIFVFTSYFLSYFSLLEGIKKIGWFGLFLMPLLITVFFYLFYFLFPGRWLTRLPFIFIYEVSIYAVLLCANIFNVGVEKNLQLYRAAYSINFFYQAVASFLFYNVLFSFKYNFLINVIGAGIFTFLLSLQLFWAIKLDKHLEKEILLYFTDHGSIEGTCLFDSELRPKELRSTLAKLHGDANQEQNDCKNKDISPQVVYYCCRQLSAH